MTDDYLYAFKGRFTSALRWHQLDALWDAVRSQNDGAWFIYAVGETPPAEAASIEQFEHFLTEIDRLLREEHDEEYCGIVYADHLQTPAYIKIFDPNNLGVSCGYSDNPPLPGWILSRIPPVNLPEAMQPPKNRRRWWLKIFH
ncbi:MAG: hypothetical protein ABFR19_03065 [Pseudomonadota bacterium]